MLSWALDLDVDWQDIFSLIDADGDGELSVEELHAYAGGAQPPTRPCALVPR